MKNIVLISGGWDPIHSGHIAYINAAKALGDILVVAVNSDAWLQRKKGRAFMPADERINIIQNLKAVDAVILFNDDDDSARQAIKNVRFMYPDDKIIFANGGDRTSKNIPEMDVLDSNIEFVFGIGGDKKLNSSSWLLDEWRAPKTDRDWGYYRVIHELDKEIKVKELTVKPNRSLSMQRHAHRKEFWFVMEGLATVYILNDKDKINLYSKLGRFASTWIDRGQWHQLCNETPNDLKIIEIQFGTECTEEDIERWTSKSHK